MFEIAVTYLVIELIVLAVAVYIINVVYGIKRTTRFIRESQWVHDNFHMKDIPIGELYEQVFKMPGIWLLVMRHLTKKHGTRSMSQADQPQTWLFG